MNQNIVKRNDLLAQTVIKGLKSRNMNGYYAHDKEEALKMALEMIEEGSSVTMGGAMSAHEIGLVEALKNGNYNFIDRDAMEDKRAAMLAAYDADVHRTCRLLFRRGSGSRFPRRRPRRSYTCSLPADPSR